jgi:hypothetical protein
MESRYNKVNKVEIFEERELVHPKIPVEHRCMTGNKQISAKLSRLSKAIDICCSANMVFFMVSRIQRRWTVLSLINFHLTRQSSTSYFLESSSPPVPC